MNEGRIFDIQSFSVHDGPGCRTNIFFSGCPLRCNWCANPESWKLCEQLLFSRRKCIGEKVCDSCVSTCDKNAIKLDASGEIIIDRDECQNCSNYICTETCVNKALRRCSRMYSVSEIMEIIERDSNNWGVKGGVTFSGGEPLFQNEFLSSLIELCRRNYIQTAIETSGYASENIFMDILSQVDFAFIDIKHIDNKAHIDGTGVSNELILSNIRKLNKSGLCKRLIIRQPVIGGYNDSLEHAKKLLKFLLEIKQYELNLLKFHRMGQSKWEQLGLAYPYASGGDVTDEQLKELQNFYLDNGIACYVGNEIIY